MTATSRPSAEAVSFTLQAVVLDDGEQVSSVILDTTCLGEIDPASVTPASFAVHASGRTPIAVPEADTLVGEYDLDRQVTGVRVAPGSITLDLAHGHGVSGANTLGYLIGQARNIEHDLTYTITQQRPICRTDGSVATISTLSQGELVSPEVDAFSAGVASGSSLNYRLFSPSGRAAPGSRALVVWLHGAGEGGWGERQTNHTQLTANRGALGFATDQAQQVFGGASVLAPQSTSAWMDDGPGFSPQLLALIDEVIAAHPDIDPGRVHVTGCSNGGYMTLRLASDRPDFFASAVPICPGASEQFFTEDELRRVSSTPTWLIHAQDDTVLPPAPHTGRAAALIDGAIVSLYDQVVWQGQQYFGHASWIYVAHNDPSHAGVRLWQWMAAQHR